MSGEIFEGFGKDFAELRGHCFLIPAVHNFNHISRTDDIIKWFNPIIAPEFQNSTSFVDKLAILFTIKEKWTLGELDTILKDTLEPEQTIAMML